MRFLFTLILVIELSFSAFSQTPNYNSTDRRINAYRNSFWFEANLNGTLARHADSSAKWQYQIDLQYRRMSDANYINGGQQYNIFADPAQHVYRPWIHYWIKPKTVRLSLSPIGYWGTWTPGKEGTQLFYSEYRICPQVTFFQKIGKLEVQQRYRYEFRWQSNKETAQYNGSLADYALGDNFIHNGQKMRLRYLLRLNYPLNGKSSGTKGSTYLTVWNELFLGLGANTANTKMLDQNRVVLLFGKYLKTRFPMKIEVGYTMQYIPKYDVGVVETPTANGTYDYGKLNWEMNNCLQVYFICDDFHSLFKRKKN